MTTTTILRELREYLEAEARELYINSPEELEESLDHLNDEFSGMYDDLELLDMYEHIIRDHLDYILCAGCNEWHSSYDITYVTNMDYDEVLDYCDSCLENAFYCEFHGRYEIGCVSHDVNDYGTICEYSNEYGDFGYCDNCDCYHLAENMRVVDDYYYYCEECYEALGCDVIGDYHNADFEFQTIADEAEVGLGFELELEFDGRYMDIAKDIKDSIENVHLEEDCSLSNGFEVVTNPMSMDYFYDSFIVAIDKIVGICKGDYNYNHNTAGFHVHTTKISDEQTTNLMYLVEYFKEELTKLAKRSGRSLDRWASFHTAGLEKAEFNEDIYDEFHKMVIDDNESRYHALNINNYHTNEFRIFKGSLDELEIKARCEICANMAAYAEYLAENDINVYEQELNFLDIITYKYNMYVEQYMQRDFMDMLQVTMEI